ncbi:penicillin-binding protein 2 [Desulfomonile tiedjei]|uniref:Peptidoglycan glycosyltransferase n=1 Tax=Desulfomonile tiedjei (strain ATCC 49306 / DSM 6799 / DCB-1) TaxID=706587 RepID=I4C9W8_DESTA|nr:penicillin-binding protein 2 [Desulfomonile tiedjei]AFM26359.1 peptidoglycan glycosyltransferase [Desulfomonile tiedjei DSM 6799]
MAELPTQEHFRDRIDLRVRIAIILMTLLMGVLAAKLWHLQLIQGDAYNEKSDSNRVRLARLTPTRGRILDVKGRVLAENTPSFVLSIVPGELEKPVELIQSYAPILGITPERMRNSIERSRNLPKYMHYPVKKNMSLEEVSLVRSRMSESRGVLLEVKPLRLYPGQDNLCHVIGTTGEISQDELAKASRVGYQTGDSLGKTGIEKEYEAYLRGEEGWEQVEIDAKGRTLATMARKPPKNGADVILTVDSAFQRFVEEVFIHRAGSVVALDPDTGRVLAMVSKPGFDLNLFSPSISERQWKTLNSDPLHPLENRATRGLYSPASTFKAITALAALSEKVVTPDKKFVCKGQLELGGQVFRCWNPYGHGRVDLHRGIVESCDTYFYELGLKLGPDRIAKYASLFGMGAPTGVGLPQELPGLVPTSAWKMRAYGDSWKDGETLTVAIGQGYLVCTPIQLAVMTAALSNGGKVFKPSIVSQIVAADGTTVFNHSPVVRWEIPIDPYHLSLLDSALVDVVTDKKGTGKRCRIPGIKVHAKTGTSQVIRVKQRTKEEDQIPYHERTHAMFIAYVNDRPQKIALIIIVEHGGGGGASAAPLARKILARYYGVPDPGDPED